MGKPLCAYYARNRACPLMSLELFICILFIRIFHSIRRMDI